MIEIAVLIDNQPHPQMDLEYEHGLSIHIATPTEQILLDVGASDKFISNATRLGIDLAQVDYLILSHAHADHTGGLQAFLQINQQASLVFSKHLPDKHYYSTRSGVKKDISPPNQVFSQYAQRCLAVENEMQVCSGCTVFGHIPKVYPLPLANKTLLCNQQADSFEHELALVLHSPEGDILFSSCCHRGLLNTLLLSKPEKLIAYLGGTHLLDSEPDKQLCYESDKELAQLAATLRQNYPKLKLISGHCTGKGVQEKLQKLLADKIDFFYSGFRIRF